MPTQSCWNLDSETRRQEVMDPDTLHILRPIHLANPIYPTHPANPMVPKLYMRSILYWGYYGANYRVRLCLPVGV